jgi:phosphotriesterase-related protein
MTDQNTDATGTVHTVLGPVTRDQLGVIATHETLLSVYPGAQYAPEIKIDRAEIFDILAEKLQDFQNHGGNTLVDASGMYHGRDVKLYEALSKATGVHIIASTGMGPERKLGGYFLTPQTNPPTPWPAEKFEKLFSAEVREGMVVPRVERRGSAGVVTAIADQTGMTPTEEGLVRGAARTAAATGVGLSLRFGADVLADLDVALDEKVSANRVLVGDMDRVDAVEHARAVAERGAFLGIDHVGLNDDPAYIDDARRVEMISELIEAGYGDRIILSSSAVGVAKGHEPYELEYSHVLQNFIPYAVAQGVAEDQVRQFVTTNPQAFLAGPVR